MAKNLYWRDIAFPSNIPITFDNNIGLEVPSGSTAQRPSSPNDGTLRFNYTIGRLELYQGGTWETITVSSVSGNTASNSGVGIGVFKEKTGDDLVFKSLVAGDNITIASQLDSILISASSVGENNTASNIGAGTGLLFSSKNGTDLRFRSIRSLSESLTVVTNGNIVDFDLTIDPGEITTASNIGSGTGLFHTKNASDLQFKSLTASSPITLGSDTTSVNIGLSNNPVFTGTGGITVPTGTTAQRPTPTSGMIRYNSTTGNIEGYTNTWSAFFTEVNGLSKYGDVMTGNLTMAAGNDIIMSAGDTVDGRDVSADGQIIDQLKTLILDNIDALKTVNNNFANFNTVLLKGHTTINDNGGGMFFLDSSDTTTANNNCTVIVDSLGRRWKRSNVTELTTDMIGIIGNGEDLGDHAKFINLMNIASALRVPIVIPGNREIIMRGNAIVPSNTYVKGPGTINFRSSQKLGEGFFADTTAGLAGTLEGDAFAVLSGDSYNLYRHNAGPVATLLMSYPYLPGGTASICFPVGKIFPNTGILGRPSSATLKTGTNIPPSTVVFNYPATGVTTRRVFYRIQIFYNSGSNRTLTFKRFILDGSNFVKVPGSATKTLTIPNSPMPSATIDIPNGFELMPGEYLGISFEASGITYISNPTSPDLTDTVEHYMTGGDVDIVPTSAFNNSRQFQIKLTWLDANEDYKNITFDGVNFVSYIENENIHFLNFACAGGRIDDVTIKNCTFLYKPLDADGNEIPPSDWPTPGSGDRWAIIFGGFIDDQRMNINLENNKISGKMQLCGGGGRGNYTNISIVRNKVFGGRQNPIALSRTGSSPEIAVWRRIHMSYNEVISDEASNGIFLGVDSQSLYTAPFQVYDCAITHNVIHSATTVSFPASILFRAPEGPDSLVRNMVISHNKISMTAGSSAIEYVSSTGTDPYSQAPINEGSISNNICIGSGTSIRILSGTNIKVSNNIIDGSIFIGSGTGSTKAELTGNRANNLRVTGNVNLFSTNNTFIASDASFCVDVNTLTGKTAVFRSVSDIFAHDGAGVGDYGIRIRGVGTNTARIITPVDSHNAWSTGFITLNDSNTLTEYVNGPNDERMTLRGDVNVTLTVGLNKIIQLFNTTLTTNRTITLSTNGANTSSVFKIIRTGGGAFSLSVGGLDTLATGEWCEVRYTGSAWVITAVGSLS